MLMRAELSALVGLLQEKGVFTLEEWQQSMIEEMGFHVIDATKSIEAQQKEMRRIVLREFGSRRPEGVLGTETPIARLHA